MSPTARYGTTTSSSSSSSLTCLQTFPLNQMAQKAKILLQGFMAIRPGVRKMVCPASPFSCPSQAVFQCPPCRSGTSCWWPATGPRTLGGRDAYRATACRERDTTLLGWKRSRGPGKARMQQSGLLQTWGSTNAVTPVLPRSFNLLHRWQVRAGPSWLKAF